MKWSRYRPGVTQRVGRCIAVLFHDRGTRRGWVVSSTPRPHFTPGKDPVPVLQEAGWAQGRSGRTENLVPTGIRSRTVQPVVSRYTDWATRPIIVIIIIIIIIHHCDSKGYSLHTTAVGIRLLVKKVTLHMEISSSPPSMNIRAMTLRTVCTRQVFETWFYKDKFSSRLFTYRNTQ